MSTQPLEPSSASSRTCKLWPSPEHETAWCSVRTSLDGSEWRVVSAGRIWMTSGNLPFNVEHGATFEAIIGGYNVIILLLANFP